jgi:hypothetical protein
MRKLPLRLKHLSQEHRAALLLSAAGRDAMPQDDSDLPSFVTGVCTIFQQEMEPHFQEEERHVLPRLRELGRDDLADRTLAEHNQMRALITQMGEAPTSAMVREFSTVLQGHVEFEEGVVWDVLESSRDLVLNEA